MKVFTGQANLSRMRLAYCLLAAPTKKRAAEILGLSMYNFNISFSQGGNALDVKLAESKPEVIFYTSDSRLRNYREYNKGK